MNKIEKYNIAGTSQVIKLKSRGMFLTMANESNI